MSYKNKKINKLVKIKDNDIKESKMKIGSFFKSIKNKKSVMFLFCFLLAFILLLLCSKCSFLYPFNGWDDFNSFYTMARGWANGLIPYRDLFDHKGPILFLIQALGLLINKNVGIFILQILNLFVTII